MNEQRATDNQEQMDHRSADDQQNILSNQPNQTNQAESPQSDAIPRAPLATDQEMPVQPGNLAAAKDALAAQRAAERAVAEQGDGAAINPDDFRSIASPLPPSATPEQPAQAEDEKDAGL
jgi:hypothetical protein